MPEKRYMLGYWDITESKETTLHKVGIYLTHDIAYKPWGSPVLNRGTAECGTPSSNKRKVYILLSNVCNMKWNQ